MTKTEKKLPVFQRPKKWFPKKDYQTVKKAKVFGLTTSNGKSIEFLVPTPWDATVWAGFVRTKLGPFLKKCYPTATSFQILLDGEKLLHAPAAKNAYKEFGITALPQMAEVQSRFESTGKYLGMGRKQSQGAREQRQYVQGV